MRRENDLIFDLTFPGSWLRGAARTDTLKTTLRLLKIAAVVRLIPEAPPGDRMSTDLAVRHLPDGSADRGTGRLRLEGGTPDTVEVSRALDGSFQLLRSSVRGALIPPPDSGGLIYETTLWFALGKLFLVGRAGEQRFTLLRERTEAGLLRGTITLSEAGEEPLKLASGEVRARRLRYGVAPALGFPADRQRGYLWIGPQGEVLQSDLWPEQRATAPMGSADNDPAFTLTRADGVVCRAEQQEKNWLLTEKAPGKGESPYEIALDFERRLQRLTSRRAGTALQAEWDGMALRYAYPALLPRFVNAPDGGLVLFLSALFLPEPIPGLPVGQKRPLLLLPLVTGDDAALTGELERLPNNPRKRKHYRLTLDGGTIASLESDEQGLVRLTSNGPLAITRK